MKRDGACAFFLCLIFRALLFEGLFRGSSTSDVHWDGGSKAFDGEGGLAGAVCLRLSTD
jgi:hypothetical protein